MADSWDDDTYVLNSKYRVAVVRHLATEGQATPTQIATATDLRQPHVSRALSELLERGVVEAVAPEERSRRRFYRLTPAGDGVWERNRGEFQPLVLRRPENPSSPEQALVDALQERFGDGLRGVARFDGERLTMLHMAPPVERAYSEGDLRDVVRDLLYEREQTRFDGDHEGGDLEFDVLGFEGFTMVRVYLARDDWIVVSLAPDAAFGLPALVETCARPFLSAGEVETLGFEL